MAKSVSKRANGDGVLRDKSGKFVPGTCGGPGNPRAGKMHAYRAVLREAASPERMRRVWNKLLDLAEAGDLVAIELVLARVYGKPTEGVDPDLWKEAEESRIQKIVNDWTVQQNAPPLKTVYLEPRK